MPGPNPVTVFPGTTCRFAPGIWMYTNAANASAVNNEFNTWMEPYYRSWLDRSKGELPGVFRHAVSLSQLWGVNENTLPNPATDPNNWDWTLIDEHLTQVDAINEGRAAFHWQLQLEGTGRHPAVTENNGFTYLPAGANSDREIVWNWLNPDAVQFLIDFYTAYASRYLNETKIYSWHFSEQSKSGPETGPAKETFLQGVLPVVNTHMCYIHSNTNLWGVNWIKNDRRIAVAMPDARLFCCGCDENFPTLSCSGGFYGPGQRMNSVLQNPPDGFKAVFSGAESNGFQIVGTGGATGVYNTPNPFGVSLPHPSLTMPNSNITPSVYVWYMGYEPRAASPRDDSGLGQPGTDPAGIIPASHIGITTTGQRLEGITPQLWDAAFRAFGAAGTQAVCHPPYGFDPLGGQGAAIPFIVSVADGSVFGGETGVVISGGNFGSTQGTGWVRMYEGLGQTGDFADQSITNWDSSGESITVTISQGSVDTGTVYFYVQNGAGDTSSAFAVQLQTVSTEPVIQTVSPTTISLGLQNVTLRGTNFGGTQGTVEINDQSDKNGTGAPQTITFWSDTEIRFTSVFGCLSVGTAYVFVEASDSSLSLPAQVTLTTTAVPTILTVEDGIFVDGETGIVITGLNFGSSQGTQGRVTLNANASGTGQESVQTIRSWSDTQIIFDLFRGVLPTGDLFLFVRSSTGQASTGWQVQVLTAENPPEVSTVSAAELYDGLTGITVGGDNFGTVQGTSTIELNTQPFGTGLGTFQTVQSWNDSTIVIDVVRGSLPLGTVYVLVRTNSGLSNGYAITLSLAGFVPTITSVGDALFLEGETNIDVVGTNFLDTQNAGEVKLYESASHMAISAVQTVNTWADELINIDLVLGSVAAGDRFIGVTNNDGRSSNFFPITIAEGASDLIVSTIDSAYTDGPGWSDFVSGLGGTVDYGNTEGVDYVITLGANVTNVVASRPAVSDGDALIAVIAIDHLLDPAVTITGTGWTSLHQVGGGPTTHVWWKQVTNAASEPATYTFDKDTDQEDMVVALIKVKTSGITQLLYNSTAATSTTVCPSITPDEADSLVFFISAMENSRSPENAGYPPGTTGSFYRYSSAAGSFQQVSLGAAFIQQTTAQATGQQTFSNLIETPARGISLVVPPPASGGASNAYNNAARTTPGDSNGDTARFTFNSLVPSTEIRVYEWHPTPPSGQSWATDVTVTITGVASAAFTIDENQNHGQWNLIRTFSSGPYSSGDLVVTLFDSASDTVVANAIMVEVDPATDNISETIVEVITISDALREGESSGTFAGGVSQAVVSFDAGSIEETIDSLDTSTLSGSTPGDFRVPLTKNYGKINEVNVTFISKGGTYSYDVDDKDVDLGPHVSIYRFDGVSYVPSDAVVDITVRGISAGE